MKKLLLSAAVLTSCAFVLPVSAQTAYSEMPAGAYELDETHASLIWKVSHLGLSNYAARFKTFDVDLTLDPTDVSKSSVVATIDPSSLETDYPHKEKKDFNKKLIEGEDWFNAGAFPEIKFVSTKIEKTGDSTGVMTGDLTFLGVTKVVSLDVTFNGAMEQHPYANRPAIGFSAIGTLKRSEWGFNTYVPNIGDEVSIQIEAEFFKAE